MTNPTSSPENSIVPILSLSDPASGVAMLNRVFGFQPTVSSNEIGVVLALGDQKICITAGQAVVGGVRPHHLALSVPDTDLAMRECLSRGGVLSSSMTPDGPLEIPEFWDEGVRYVFFEGPEGALIELCMKKGVTGSLGWGHDHIGIQCDDINGTQADFLAKGCKVVTKYVLQRTEGGTEVAFLERGGSVIELFSPPKPSVEHHALVGWVGFQ